MARITYTAQKANTSGPTVNFTAADAAGAAFFPLTGRALHIKNGSGSSITCTVPTPLQIDSNLAVGDRTFTIAAGAHAMFACAATDTAYLQPDGTVWVDFSLATSVTVALLDGANV